MGGECFKNLRGLKSGGWSVCALLAALALILVLADFSPALAEKGSSSAGAPEERVSSTGDAAFNGFEEFEQEEAPVVFDPLGGYNRAMTQVNDRLYFWVIKPAAKAYGTVVPEFLREAVNRFFANLGFPIRFVNNILQLKLKCAGVEAARFGLNSTAGLAGFLDPAQKWFHLSPHEEDFGQTLGHYGVNGGFHLVLPVLGPSNFRDTLAMVPDGFLNPLYYIEDESARTGVTVFKTVNRASLHIGEYESLRKDAIDLYILLRNAYEQNREKEIEE